MSNYILVNNIPVLEPDLIKWSEWYNDENRRVAHDTADVTYHGSKVGQVRVSTVFLGTDHNFYDLGDPILFETMVFGGALDEELERCSTYNEALMQHKLMIERVKNSVDNNRRL